MGVRTNTVLSVEVGQDNTLDDSLFERSFTALLDTLDHATSQVLTLDASTTNYAVPFGAVTQARLIYIESDIEIEVSFGGGVATGASVTAVGGTYPTSFTGTETLLLEIDGGGLITCTFDVADQSLVQVINRINACAALNGQANVAFDNGGELQITSPTTGITSEVDIQGGTGAATLGLSVAVTNGINSNPGTSNLMIQRPADPTGASAAAGVLAYFLATINTGSVLLTNNSTTLNATVRVMIAGDLVAAVC
jgi:hypothetical protein